MKLLVYKFCMVICVAGILSLLLFACNGAKEVSKEADSAATTLPKVESTLKTDSTQHRTDSIR
ncbi:hypothetical protein [Chitinophaga nivalis]|uniref:Uncharacterized protein n=1 Tax=Chitinophaga nivalis TaxID=2991709 RepID=A0ABT3IL25_9BACT|nr:hypothetical protein [Chitinophaga nivalis]MCW3465639.1 hypothetical protein [Chitinophaga nivalis]MCW3484670.1 hypothetical protein [Chitinophaga nivalis]